MYFSKDVLPKDLKGWLELDSVAMLASLYMPLSSSTNGKDTIWVSEAFIFSESLHAHSSADQIPSILLCPGTRTMFKACAKVSIRILMH